jgi:hypothetical protein
VRKPLAGVLQDGECDEETTQIQISFDRTTRLATAD